MVHLNPKRAVFRLTSLSRSPPPFRRPLALPSAPTLCNQNQMFPGLGGATPTAGGPAAAEQASAPAEDGTKLIDLSEKLDKSSCYARNENSAYPWGNLFIGDSRLGMQSDADEQLIIHLSFQEFMRVCS